MFPVLFPVCSQTVPSPSPGVSLCSQCSVCFEFAIYPDSRTKFSDLENTGNNRNKAVITMGCRGRHQEQIGNSRGNTIGPRPFLRQLRNRTPSVRCTNPFPSLLGGHTTRAMVRRGVSPASALMFDRGLFLAMQAIRRQLAAMPHDPYLVRLIHYVTGSEFPGERLWTAAQLARSGLSDFSAFATVKAVMYTSNPMQKTATPATSCWIWTTGIRTPWNVCEAMGMNPVGLASLLIMNTANEVETSQIR
jgi:hypothetical protein